MKVLIVMAILMLTGGLGWGSDNYIPPTDAEISGWWEELSRDERMAELRKLDTIEHAEPTTNSPQMVIIQTENGVMQSYFNDCLEIDIGGYLQYTIELPEATAKGNRKVNRGLCFGAGGVAGVVITAIIFSLVNK